MHIDFAGRFLGVYFLILVDAFSKWPEIHVMNRMDTDFTIGILDKIFTTFGYPQVLVSDNGSQFVNPKFQKYLLSHGIKHKHSAPYNPATNGQAEHYVQILKTKLKCLKANNNNLQENLNKILFQYRITPHATTMKAPTDMIFRYPVNSRFSLMCPKTMVNENLQCNRNNNVYRDKVRTLLVGDRVSVPNYLHGQKWEFGTTAKVLGRLHYMIKMDNGLLWHRQIDQIKKIGKRVKPQDDYYDYFNDSIITENPVASLNIDDWQNSQNEFFFFSKGGRQCIFDIVHHYCFQF